MTNKTPRLRTNSDKQQSEAASNESIATQLKVTVDKQQTRKCTEPDCERQKESENNSSEHERNEGRLWQRTVDQNCANKPLEQRDRKHGTNAKERYQFDATNNVKGGKKNQQETNKSRLRNENEKPIKINFHGQAQQTRQQSKSV